MPRPGALVVTERGSVLHSLRGALDNLGIAPCPCRTVGEAERVLFCRPVCMAFSDFQLLDGDFREVISATKIVPGRIPTIVTGRVWDWVECLEALRYGAFEYEDYGCPEAEWERLVKRAMATVSFSLIFNSDGGHKAVRPGGHRWQTREWTYLW